MSRHPSTATRPGASSAKRAARSSSVGR
jgi:hypothetical protein